MHPGSNGEVNGVQGYSISRAEGHSGNMLWGTVTMAGQGLSDIGKARQFLAEMG